MAFLSGCVRLIFHNLITTRNPQVHPSLTNEGRYVGCRQEDKGYGMILDKSNIQSCFASELYVGASEEVEGGLLEAALYA